VHYRTVTTAVNYPGAIHTQIYGINDAGHLVGRYQDLSSWHGFLKYQGNFYSIDVPLSGVIETDLWGINGDGKMIGTYEQVPTGWHGFTATKDFTTGIVSFDYVDYPGWEQTFTYGINNNSQLVGNSAYFPEQVTGFLFTSNGFLPLQYTGLRELRGINEAAQIVGWTVDESLNAHAFLVLP
jgi:hypothetical protein